MATNGCRRLWGPNVISETELRESCRDAPTGPRRLGNRTPSSEWGLSSISELSSATARPESGVGGASALRCWGRKPRLVYPPRFLRALSVDDIAARTAFPAATQIDVTFDNRRHLMGLSVWIARLKFTKLGVYASCAKAEVRRRIWLLVRLNHESSRLRCRSPPTSPQRTLVFSSRHSARRYRHRGRRALFDDRRNDCPGSVCALSDLEYQARRRPRSGEDCPKRIESAGSRRGTGTGVRRRCLLAQRRRPARPPTTRA